MDTPKNGQRSRLPGGYLVKWTGYPLNASTWEPASSFDPPYEEMTTFWIAARVGGRDWMNMREFRNGDRVFWTQTLVKSPSPFDQAAACSDSFQHMRRVCTTFIATTFSR
ncbi:hypothetical protein C8F01DRAFT_1263391 [Mycena amicta]|nr:hypothetical protein C8F01DRAFT_1263391 [Mycena amicta]